MIPGIAAGFVGDRRIFSQIPTKYFTIPFYPHIYPNSVSEVIWQLAVSMKNIKKKILWANYNCFKNLLTVLIFELDLLNCLWCLEII